MKKSSFFNAFRKVVFSSALLFSISVFNTSDAFATQQPVYNDTITQGTVPQSNPKLKQGVNPANEVLKLLPEVLQSFGYTDKKLNKEFRKISRALTATVNRLNRYASMKDFSDNPAKVKHMLSDMNLRIGGSQFDSRPLSPEFVSKFTPENIRQVATALKHLQMTYKELAMQNGMESKIGVLMNFRNMAADFKNIELLTAFGKEYTKWITELSITAKMTQGEKTPLVRQSQPAIDSTTVSVDTTFTYTLGDERAQGMRVKRNADKEIFDRAYVMTPQQVKVSSIKYDGGDGCKLVSIDRGEKETMVTIAVPIHFESNWINTDSAFYLLDKSTNDRYYPRRMENNIPLNRIIIVKNQAHKMIEICYVFPPLNKSVEWIDIIEDLENSTVELPSNAAKAWELHDVNVNAYKKGKIYR